MNPYRDNNNPLLVENDILRELARQAYDERAHARAELDMANDERDAAKRELNGLKRWHEKPILLFAAMMIASLMSCAFRVGEFVGYAHHEAQETENARLNLENEFLLDASRQLLIENRRLEAAANARELDWDAIVVDEFGTQCLDSELEGPEGTCPVEEALPAALECDCSTPACCSYEEYLRAVGSR